MNKLWALAAVMGFSNLSSLIYGFSVNFSGAVMGYLVALAFIMIAFIAGLIFMSKNAFAVNLKPQTDR
ncbi:MAG: hypothetical protein CMM52_00665 [Rhodospirillaceae bacterium]|nr:hypothetical protein [Rhodospirillaceae bacterium]|tara:strand:+ start:194 stop:397 length:204 start_codon:yes stop_codon:yes gene_type:complete